VKAKPTLVKIGNHFVLVEPEVFVILKEVIARGEDWRPALLSIIEKRGSKCLKP